MNAIKTTERKLAIGTPRHAPSTLMAWCVGNLKIEPTAHGDQGDEADGLDDAKIDPIMALARCGHVHVAKPAAWSEQSALTFNRVPYWFWRGRPHVQVTWKCGGLWGARCRQGMCLALLVDAGHRCCRCLISLRRLADLRHAGF